VPNAVTHYEIGFPANDHVFLNGHRIMVQVQSTWFPVIDRNPPALRAEYLPRERVRLSACDPARVPLGAACFIHRDVGRGAGAVSDGEDETLKCRMEFAGSFRDEGTKSE